METLACFTTPKQSCTVPYSIVLVQLDGDRDDRFVTWERNDTNGSFIYGHYFKSFAEAYPDFQKRVKNHIDRYPVQVFEICENIDDDV